MAKILVAEDDTMLSTLLVKRLRVEGFEVAAAYDGQQTIDKIQEWQPDLLLLDILLPVKDGFAVLEAFKQGEHRDSRLHVIILSNLSDQDQIGRSKQYEVDDYLIKVNTQLDDVAKRIHLSLGESATH
jgi:DNA-binding response OmpR family regulator